MSLETLYSEILAYRIPIILLLVGSPWVIYLLCFVIPQQREEPLLLSVNLALSTLSILMLVGYLAYATNTGGWAQVVTQADVVLLLLPPYHLAVSLWLSRLRLPLQLIPAFRTMQGLLMLRGGFFSTVLGAFKNSDCAFFLFAVWDVFRANGAAAGIGLCGLSQAD